MSAKFTEPCEHDDHIRPADKVCIECGEVVDLTELSMADLYEAAFKDGVQPHSTDDQPKGAA